MYECVWEIFVLLDDSSDLSDSYELFDVILLIVSCQKKNRMSEKKGPTRFRHFVWLTTFLTRKKMCALSPFYETDFIR